MELGLKFYCVVQSFHNMLKANLSYNNMYSHSVWLPFKNEHRFALLTLKGRATELSTLKGAVRITAQIYTSPEMGHDFIYMGDV